MRQAAAVPLRRRRDGEARHARLLRRDDVHHDGRRVDGQATGRVEPDAAHGHPPLADLGARRDLDREVLRALRSVHEPDPADRLLEPCPTCGSSAASAAAISSAGTRRCSGRTPSKRSAYSRRASAPRVRTASRIGATRCAASSTPTSARGRASASSRADRNALGDRCGRSCDESRSSGGSATSAFRPAVLSPACLRVATRAPRLSRRCRPAEPRPAEPRVVGAVSSQRSPPGEWRHEPLRRRPPGRDLRRRHPPRAVPQARRARRVRRGGASSSPRARSA